MEFSQDYNSTSVTATHTRQTQIRNLPGRQPLQNGLFVAVALWYSGRKLVFWFQLTEIRYTRLNFPLSGPTVGS